MNYIVIYHRNSRLYYINFTSITEAYRVAKDLEGEVFQGTWLTKKEVTDKLKLEVKNG